jgi:hypothetical protein
MMRIGEIAVSTTSQCGANGEGLETTYAMNPKPIKKLDEDLACYCEGRTKSNQSSGIV